MKTLYKAGIAFLFFALVAGRCPEKETIVPCICGDIKNGISVQCDGPHEANRIASIVENFEDTENLELVLDSASLTLSPTAFKQVSALHLYNVRIEKTRSDSPFQWSKLLEVIIESSSIADKAVPNFRNADLLNHLEISKVEMPSIGFEFKESIPASITYLDIRKTQTISLQPQALSNLKKLQYFILVDLPLQEFPRSALPEVMPNLHTFIIGNTKLEKFEADFFIGMPRLEVLMLNGNKLKTLDHNLFAPVENQLSHLLAERNPLTCNCNLLWLSKNVQEKGAMKVLATCKDNATQKRKDVITLKEEEYC